MAWNRNQINELLKTNPKAVERAIVRLYELQTNEEKQTQVTRIRNGAGFSSAHSYRGSYYAKWVMSGRNLTGAHLERARTIAIRHSGQLVAIANSK